MTFGEALRTPELKWTWPWILTSLPVLLILEYQAVAPLGHSSLLFFELIYGIGMLVAMCAIIVLPFLLIRRGTRMLVLAWLLAAVVFLPLAFGGLLLGHRIRHWGFDRLAVRSDSLIAAIHSYATKNGRPPSSLDQLVPNYLPQIPHTGMMAYPDYEYYVGPDAQPYDNNPWVLVVETPSGGINFDKFMYFPLRNYPRYGYGGSLERVRDWAYVHE